MKNETEEQFEIVIKTHHGLEEILAQEVEECGGKNPEIITRGVKFTGDRSILYCCTLGCNTAMNVLITLDEFEIDDIDDLYNKALDIPWEKYFSVSKTFAVKGVIYADYVKNTLFPALRLKDAIADRFSKIYKERPNVDKENPEVLIQLLLRNKEVTVSLDTSGEPLNRRGYRIRGLEAPINEALAAGIIKLSGWDGADDLYDPFCGSGTFLTEAAIIASNKPPNAMRKDFCLKNFKNYDSDLWYEILDELKQKERPLTPDFYAGDVYRGAIEASRKHWIKLGFPPDKLILENRDFKFTRPRSKKGYLITNPPYGKRLSDHNVKYLYRDLGDLLKNHFKGFTAAVISGSEEGLKNLGLRPDKKVRLFNGPIESKLYVFKIFAGNLKDKKRRESRRR